MPTPTARRQFAVKSRFLLGLITATVVACGGMVWQRANSPVQKHIEAGVRFQQSGEGAAAVQQWRQAVQKDPGNEEAWELLGDYYLATKNYENAHDAFESLSKIDSDISDLKERSAVCSLQLKDYAASRKSAETALKENPQSIVALQVMAEVEKYEGKSDARLKYLRTLSDLQPQNPRILLDLVNELGERQEYDKAIPIADRLVSVSPNSANAYHLRGSALFKANFDANSLKRAEADFQKVLELEPTDVEAHRYLGRIYLQSNQPRLAVTQFEAVGRGRPYASAHLLELSNAYRQSGNKQRADQLRALFTRLNQFNARLIAAKKAIELRPNNAQNYLQMILLLTRGIGADENIYQLCRYRYLSEEIQSADFYLNKAKQLQPHSEQVQVAAQQLERLYVKHLQAGLQSLRRRDDGNAQRHLGRAAILVPTDERTLQALQQIPHSGSKLPDTTSAPFGAQGLAVN